MSDHMPQPGSERPPGTDRRRPGHADDQVGDDQISDDQTHDDQVGDDQISDAERAARIAEDVSADNPDPITRREAIELELEDEDLSHAGETLGEHVE
jgi:hypothetical protein